MADRRSKVFWALLAGSLAVGAFIVWRVAKLSRSPAEEPKAAKESKASKEAAAPFRPYDGPTYVMPEELAKDHKKAFEYAGGANATATLALADYFACQALQKRSPDACAEFDSWNTKARQTPPCRVRYFTALLLKSAFGSSPSVQACLDYLAVSNPVDDTDRKACEAALPLMRKGDYKALCDAAIQAGSLRPQDRPACETDTSYLAGDEELCLQLTDQGARTGCGSKALLVKALRENKPALLKGSPFASIMGVSEDEPCKAAGQAAVEGYQKDAMTVFNERTKWDEKAYRAQQEQKERQEKARKAAEEENAKNEALLHEAEAKRLAFEAQSAKAAAEEKKQAEERQKQVDEWLAKEEKAKAERAAKKEQDEKLKFEAARQADELRRRKENLGMKDDPPKGPPKDLKAKGKAKAKTGKEPAADAVMISADKEEEESQ